MTAPVWETPVGFLGTLTERKTTSTSISAVGSDITYRIIAGNLPNGLGINTVTGIISGTPLSVSINKTSEFVIRAENANGLNDRMFKLDVIGPTAPVWSTNSGLLPLGINGEYYAINKEYVDFMLRAETDILTSGNNLRFFIADNQGQLPPGLTLLQSGRIVGYIDDMLKLDPGASITGGYDDEIFDIYPYDHSTLSTGPDLSKPESINKMYQFFVTVSDGIASSTRMFKIEVVDPNSLRADNTFINSDTNRYDISASYLLPPLWQDSFGELLPYPANLGTFRASREQVISLYDYDPYPFVGPVSFDWSTTVNAEIKLITDSRTNIVGLPTKNLAGDKSIYFKGYSKLPIVGMYLRLDDYITEFDDTTYIVTGVIRINENLGIINLNLPLKATIPDSKVIYIGTPSVHPPGLELDSENGQIYGRIPYQPAFSRNYKFTIKIIKTDLQTGKTVSKNQIFLFRIKGNIDSDIQFISTGSLGTLIAGQISELKIVAENVSTNYSIQYSLVGGLLPRGLSLNTDGTIQGTVQYQSQTYFDNTSTEIQVLSLGETLTGFRLDNGATTIDRQWTFTVRASDVYKLSAIEKDFSITVIDSTIEYTQIYLRPFLESGKRTLYKEFTSNPITFDPAILYRPLDPEFGVQSQIKMIIEFGIEKVEIEKYIDVMQDYFRRKRFYFGDVKSILAKDSNGKEIYELVYIEIIDNQMNGNSSPPYAISVGNMQTQLESIQLDSNSTILVDEFLRPKYMNTIQLTTGIPLGFIKAVPICYVLPGNSAKILSRIRSSGFNFQQFDFDTDRIIIKDPSEPDENGWLYYPIN